MNKRFETIRRVIITYKFKFGNNTEGDKAIEWCYRNGYEIKCMGFARGKIMKVGKIIAEKKIKI